jgi:YrbI family 3-deoxy-D-manno-octulosonate 8-phosphate phosphatase
MPSKNLKNCKNLKLVLSDVDGVLTDGGMYFSEKGEFLKKFNTKDGMGVELLLKNKIPTILITREKTLFAKRRGKKIKAEKIFSGVSNKKLILKKICDEYKIKPENIAYIGDDINDKEIMEMVGFSATPKDGMESIKKISDYICKLKGGEGVFREVAELIIKNQK